jgi:glycosyltransferase involved in cell wall biosynthesis
MDLISLAHRLLVGVEAKVPGIRPLTNPLRWAFHLTDTALAALLFVFWVLSYGLYARIARGMRAKGKAASGTVCFLSQEGFTVAPARIRTYYFAERVARLGIPTRTLAFWDDIYRFRHLPDRIVLSVERVVVALRAAHRLLADPPAAIVQQRPNYDLITTWALHWVHGTPVVFDIDDWIGDYPWFFPLRVRSVLPRCRALASACVVSSRRLERGLRGLFPRLVRIPTYVDTEVFRPRAARAATAEIVFGWNGTLFQKFMYDSLLLMLRAFRRACGRLDPATPVALEIAGTGGYFGEVEKALAAEFAGCPVRIRGWIDPRSMAQYLDGIDVGLYSLTMVAEGPESEDGRFIVSKSPTKVFEYMAKGIPTISTRVGEVAYFLQHGVTGFCSDDVDELADAFVTLAKDPELRGRMGAAARQLCVDQYSMAASAAMLADLITEVGDLESRSGAKSSRRCSLSAN